MSTSRSTGITSSRSTATPTVRTTNAGRCWAPGPSRRRACRSARWSRATRTATPNCWPTWRAPSTTSATAGSILGIGSGWKQKDYDEYGYEFGTAGSRLDDLAGRVSADQATAGQAQSAAPTRDIPILIGGGGEKKTLRLVAEYGDIWHSFSDSSEYPRKAEILARPLRRRRPRSRGHRAVRGRLRRQPGCAARGGRRAGRARGDDADGRRQRARLRPDAAPRRCAAGATGAHRLTAEAGEQLRGGHAP